MTKYRIQLEVFESTCSKLGHKKGDRFNYPDDKGKICHWLLSAAEPMIRVLEYGGELKWTYQGTPYEKIIDLNGITTEYVRCPDPSGHYLVLKITRECVSD